jgi:hypothetical protein
VTDQDTEETQHEETQDQTETTTAADATEAGDGPEAEAGAGTGEEETFSRRYVEELRQENGKYRQRARRADALSHRLHAELVRATGKLADPSDLAFDEAHLEDPATLSAAVDALLTAKPHLAPRRPMGDIGQGAKPAGGGVDLAAILRGAAG